MKRWLKHTALPALQHVGDKVVHRITNEKGQQHWTALQPSRRWSSWIIWTLVSVSGFGIVWSSFARIDETVQAIGKLEPKGTTTDVKAPMGGVVLDILVKDGQSVRAGQVLLEMDTTAAKSKLKALKAVRERVEADLQLSQGQLGGIVDRSQLSQNQVGKLAALRSEYGSRISAARSGVGQAQTTLDAAQYQLKAKRDALRIREQILRDIAPLASQGAMARSQFLKEKQEVILLRGEVRSLVSNVGRSREALDEARFKLANTEAMTKIDFSSKVEESEKQLAELSSQISEAELTLKYQKIRSPVNGLVFDLKPTAPGFVVQSEVPMLKIVPTDHLVSRIFVSNRDIGFVRTGQLVKVRVDAFPYNEFGELSGRVQSIGSDVLAPDQTYDFFRFPVTVALDRSALRYKGRDLVLRSGMSISANVVLRQRPVIAIFTQQLLPFWDSLQKL
jgi:HlyD family secretion protein